MTDTQQGRGTGIKLAVQVSPDPTPEELQLVRQMGVEYVTLWSWGDKCESDYYLSRRRLIEEAGLKLKFWGAPYGTSENSICVYKGTVEDYKLAFQQAPFTDSRTIMVRARSSTSHD